MAANLSFTPDSVETYNLGGVTMKVHNFITNKVNPLGPRGFYSSSLQSVVGYWFNATDTPTTASLNGLDVSLIATATGQFRFTGNRTAMAGKFYTLSLT